MQRIIVDCRFAATETGLGRYTRELLSAIVPRNAGLAYVLLVRSAEEKWIQELPGHMAMETHEAPFAHYSLGEQTRLPLLLRSLQASLYFVPHFNVPLFCPMPFVCTVHDLILHRYPNQASYFKQCAYRSVMQHAVKKAASLIAVSDFTASELASVYGKAVAAKTNVVREAASPLFCSRPESDVQKLRKTHDLHRPFFLYVGNAKQHKNVQLIIDAFRASMMTDHDLVLITHGPEVDRLQIGPGVKIIRSIDDSELPVFYTAAKAFVTASLYEGFCLPIAEAQACGCPVIATALTAIPEVSGKDALLLQPTVEAISHALKHPPARTKSPVSTRHWSQVAEETVEILQRAVEKTTSSI